VWEGGKLVLEREWGDRLLHGIVGHRVRLPGRHVHPAVQHAGEQVRLAQAERDGLDAEIAARVPAREQLTQKLVEEARVAGPGRVAAAHLLKSFDAETELISILIPGADLAVRDSSGSAPRFGSLVVGELHREVVVLLLTRAMTSLEVVALLGGDAQLVALDLPLARDRLDRSRLGAASGASTRKLRTELGHGSMRAVLTYQPFSDVIAGTVELQCAPLRIERLASATWTLDEFRRTDEVGPDAMSFLPARGGYKPFRTSRKAANLAGWRAGGSRKPRRAPLMTSRWMACTRGGGRRLMT
jgi:hypothetical protein